MSIAGIRENGIPLFGEVGALNWHTALFRSPGIRGYRKVGSPMDFRRLQDQLIIEIPWARKDVSEETDYSFRFRRDWIGIGAAVTMSKPFPLTVWYG